MLRVTQMPGNITAGGIVLSIGHPQQVDAEFSRSLARKGRELGDSFGTVLKQLAQFVYYKAGAFLGHTTNIGICEMQPLLASIARIAGSYQIGRVIIPAVGLSDDMIDLKPNVGGVLAAILAGKLVPSQDLESQLVETVNVSHVPPPTPSITEVTPWRNCNGNGKRV